MPAIRVLVVDDSAVVRRLLCESMSADPQLEVVGTAPNGRIALAKVAQKGVDVVILDVEMPEMSGLETLAAIRRSFPRLPVILFSALTERAAAVTIDGLAMGASDYVTKPSCARGAAPAADVIRGELIPKIKAVCVHSQPDATTGPERPAAPDRRAAAHAPPRREARRAGPWTRIEVVAIGTSTGGPAALNGLMPLLPAGFPVPIVVVQHMPPTFTRLFAERLAAVSPNRVTEASGGEILRPGDVWIAPGDSHLVVERSGSTCFLRTNKQPARNSCRPSVDALFESVANAYGPASLAVVLTGMGQDGLAGCTCIREAGGRVIAQDEASSVVWGMPGSVVKADLADDVIPLHGVAREIVRRVQEGRRAMAPALAGARGDRG